MVRGVQHPSREEALVAHRTARLNVFGRQLLVTRIELDGWPVARPPRPRASAGRPPTSGWPGIARRAGSVSRIAPRDRTARRAGPRPRRSARSSRRGSNDAGARIAWDRSLGHPRSTVYAVLARARLSPAARRRPAVGRPGAATSATTRARSSTRTTRSSAASPMAAAIGCSGRRRAEATAGATSATTTSRCVVDDHTRLAYVAHVPDESAPQRRPALLEAAVWFAGAGRPHRARPDRQRVGLHEPTLCAGARGDRGAAQADPAVPTADQRQGRAVHQDAARRVGLRPALSLQRRAPR